MKRLGVALLIVSLAVSAAGARTPHRGHAPLRHRVSYHHAKRRQRFHLSAEMKDDGRGAAAINRAALRRDGYLDPNVTRRFGKGVYASFGVQRDAVRPPLQPAELNGVANTRLNHAESPAGVKVGIPF